VFHSLNVKMSAATAIARMPITSHTKVSRSSLLAVVGPASESKRLSEIRPCATAQSVSWRAQVGRSHPIHGWTDGTSSTPPLVSGSWTRLRQKVAAWSAILSPTTVGLPESDRGRITFEARVHTAPG
jgi:hypothetical protein